jgi:hypothetical protein
MPWFMLRREGLVWEVEAGNLFGPRRLGVLVIVSAV